MKIELGASSANQLQVERSAKQVSGSGVSGISRSGEDRATLQSDSAAVQALVQQALTLPEVRQGKVDAVRQAVNSGQFQVNPQKIAGGILAESEQ
jgi:negative regulator of flagellin synthesis FlgM